MLTVLSLSPAIDKIYFVDNFEAGRMYRAGEVVKSAGGKGVNVARVASILGEPVKALGFKAGETGSWLVERLKKLGADTGGFIEVDGETRTNNNIIDRITGKETEVLEPGPVISPADAGRFLDVFENTLTGTGVLVCSGGLPIGLPVDFYRTLIDTARICGIKVILDTSGEMLVEGIKAKPFMIKPNMRELGKLTGRKPETPEEVVKACREVLEGGVECVAASMGGRGAVLVSKEQAIFAAAPDIQVVNTIGSGDSMVAGLAVGLARGCTPEETFRLGIACATANTQYREIGMVDIERVERYKREVIVKNI